jgi:positive regulator of sigma E activity
MIEEEGVVIVVEGKTATVSVLKKSACESCAAAGVCHPQDADKSLLTADNPLHATKGQRVKVQLAPQVYFRRSALVQYGVPAAALVSGAIIAKNLAMRFGAEAQSDFWALLSGTACLLLAYGFIRIQNKKVEQLPNYKPVIVEILS